MLIKTLAVAAATGVLMTSAAYAGDKAHKADKTAAAMESSATSATTVNPNWAPSGQAALSADSAETTSDVAATMPMSTSDALAAGGTVQITASTPVADTPENRAMYEPLSATGKRTRAAGN